MNEQKYKGDMSDCPCKPDCPNREVGCHATCEDGKAWDKAHKERSTRIYNERVINYMSFENARYNETARLKKIIRKRNCKR